MKRSRSVKLLTMTSISLVLAACGNSPDTEGEIYQSIEECSSAGFVPAEDCATLISEGQRMHKESAPRYSTSHLCTSNHDNARCSKLKDEDEEYFSPSPAGYLVTGALAGAAASSLVRPIYPGVGRRSYYMPGGGRVFFIGRNRYGASGRDIRRYDPNVRRAPPRVQTRTSVASRLGFGSRSGGLRARGFGG